MASLVKIHLMHDWCYARHWIFHVYINQYFMKCSRPVTGGIVFPGGFPLDIEQGGLACDSAAAMLISSW